MRPKFLQSLTLPLSPLKDKSDKIELDDKSVENVYEVKAQDEINDLASTFDVSSLKTHATGKRLGPSPTPDFMLPQLALTPPMPIPTSGSSDQTDGNGAPTVDATSTANTTSAASAITAADDHNYNRSDGLGGVSGVDGSYDSDDSDDASESTRKDSTSSGRSIYSPASENESKFAATIFKKKRKTREEERRADGELAQSYYEDAGINRPASTKQRVAYQR